MAPPRFLPWLLAAGLPLSAETFYSNPILTEGADPDIIHDGERWHIYYTDQFNTAHRSSPDGISDWSEKTVAFDGDRNRAGWAPSLHRAEDGQWYLYNVGAVARAEAPDASFTRVRGPLGFDPQIFRDPVDSKVWFVAGGSHAGQFVAPLVSPTSLGERTALYFLPPTGWGRTWEGLHILRHPGPGPSLGASPPEGPRIPAFLMLLSINSANAPTYRLVHATADSIEGPWTLQEEDSEAAFLRRSEAESIQGPGHHALRRDSLGTLWVYYQQHNDSGGNWNRGIAIDPLWFDASGNPFLRPTRGVRRPGPDSPPESIWPARPPGALIPVESHDGSRYLDLVRSETGRWSGRNLKSGAVVAFRSVDFGDGFDGILIHAANGSPASQMPSMAEVRLHAVDGPLIANVPIPANHNWEAFNNHSGAFDRTLKGRHDVFIIARGPSVGGEAFRLEAIQLKNRGYGRAIPPPIAAADTVTTPVDESVTIDVLANDRDPDGKELVVASAGTLEHELHSQRAGETNLQVLDNGRITYTPPAGFWGTDRFFYTLSNSEGALARGEVAVTILPRRHGFQRDGRLEIEAEEFTGLRRNKDTLDWEVVTGVDGASAGSALGTADQATRMHAGETGGAPAAAQAEYAVTLEAGIHTAWARIRAPDTDGDEAVLFLTTDATTGMRADVNQGWRIEAKTPGTWEWVRVPVRLSTLGGLHRIGLRRGDDGLLVDRLVLTLDPDWTPEAEP